MGRKRLIPMEEAVAHRHELYVKRREARKAAGICTRCGVLDAVPGRTMCIPCRDRDLRDSRRRYIADVFGGKCPSCHKPLTDDYPYTVCPGCREMHNKYGDAYRAEKRREKMDAV